MADRLPPPPFWRTRYYDEEVSRRPDRQDIAADEILAAIAAPILIHLIGTRAASFVAMRMRETRRRAIT